MKIEWRPKTKLDRAGVKIVRLFNDAGFQAFWVGGGVRGMLLKRPSDDLDIATDATPLQTEKLLAKAKIKTKPVGKKFGTILAIVDKLPIEITTFRSEGDYKDKRHPNQVEFIKDYLQDAKRRDFTVNAMYFNPIEKFLYDPTGGKDDLRRGLLRLVGNPKQRIDEDALRMLRGVRLSLELGMRLEDSSFAAMKTRVKFIQEISGERVKTELDKILSHKKRSEGLRLLDSMGLLQYIIPEFEKLKKTEHKAGTFHLEGSIFNHTMKAVEILQTDDLDVVYGVLFHDLGKVIRPIQVADINPKGWRWSFRGHAELSGQLFAKFADKYHFSRQSKKRVLDLIARHEDRGSFVKTHEKAQIRYLLALGETEALFEVWRVDSSANLLLENGRKVWGKAKSVLLAKKLLVKIQRAQKYFKLADGKLIMAYSKLKPGIKVGKKIIVVKTQIVLGKIKNKTDLKKFLQ